MTDVLLVTCADWPDGEPGGHLLLEELTARSVSARWVVWDEPSVDWTAAGVVVVRSTWDYQDQRDRFLAWARAVEATSRLVNNADVLAWNTDKAYLLDLATSTLPVVPTLAAAEESELQTAIATFGTAVVKPRVGAHGRGVVVFDGEPGGEPGLDESRLDGGPWIVQPLVASIRSEGEASVFVLGGRAVSQVQKRPAAGDIRVHEEYGGRSAGVPLSPEAATLAQQAVKRAESVLDAPLPYARVDLMRLADGTLAVSELEVAEPGLYLDLVPQNAGWFADAVVDLLGS